MADDEYGSQQPGPPPPHTALRPPPFARGRATATATVPRVATTPPFAGGRAASVRPPPFARGAAPQPPSAADDEYGSAAAVPPPVSKPPPVVGLPPGIGAPRTPPVMGRAATVPPPGIGAPKTPPFAGRAAAPPPPATTSSGADDEYGSAAAVPPPVSKPPPVVGLPPGIGAPRTPPAGRAAVAPPPGIGAPKTPPFAGRAAAPPPPATTSSGADDEYGSAAAVPPPVSKPPPVVGLPPGIGAPRTPPVMGRAATVPPPGIGAPKTPPFAGRAAAPPPPATTSSGADDEYGSAAAVPPPVSKPPPVVGLPPGIGSPRTPPAGRAAVAPPPGIGAPKTPPFAGRAAAPPPPATATTSSGADDEYGSAAAVPPPVSKPPPVVGHPPGIGSPRTPPAGRAAVAPPPGIGAPKTPPFAGRAAAPPPPATATSGAGDEYGSAAAVPPPVSKPPPVVGHPPGIGSPRTPPVGRAASLPPHVSAPPPPASSVDDDEYGSQPNVPPPVSAPHVGGHPPARVVPAGRAGSTTTVSSPLMQKKTAQQEHQTPPVASQAAQPQARTPLGLPPPPPPPPPTSADEASSTPEGGDEYGNASVAAPPPVAHLPPSSTVRSPAMHAASGSGSHKVAISAAIRQQAQTKPHVASPAPPMSAPPPPAGAAAEQDEYGSTAPAAPPTISPAARPSTLGRGQAPLPPPQQQASPSAGGDDEYGPPAVRPPLAVKPPSGRGWMGASPLPPPVAPATDDEYGPTAAAPPPGFAAQFPMPPPVSSPRAGLGSAPSPPLPTQTTWKATGHRQTPSGSMGLPRAPLPPQQGTDEYGASAPVSDEYGPGISPPIGRLPVASTLVVTAKPKQRTKPTALIKLPKHVADSPLGALYSLNAVDRSTWVYDALQSNPHIVDLRERIYPLHRSISFCRIFHPGKKEVKENITQAHVVQLIMQHLQLKGFKETRKTLERESHVKPPKHRLHSSRLVAALRSAVRATEEVYDLMLGEKVKDSQPLDEHLWWMGLQEEEEEQEDVNIWSESGEGNLSMDNDGTTEVVKAGSFNKLVEKLTDEVDTHLYLPTFLMTYQSFTTPEKFLQKLAQRFNVPVEVEASDEGKKKAVRIRARVCNVMKKWIEDNPGDFDDRLITQMKQFIDHAMSTPSAPFAAAVSKAFQKMMSEAKGRGGAAARRLQLQQMGDPPEPIVPPNFFSQSWSLLDLDEEELARQLTLMDWEIFERIKPAELLNQAWSKPKLRHRAPNVLALIKRFNQVSGWVSTEILECATIRDRVRVVTKFIHIAERLLALNNFNSLMTISAALNSSPISRLRFTTEELAVGVAKTKRELEDLMNNNWKLYRQRLTQIPNGVPCLPYLGVCLTDLTFVDENPDTVRGLINFSKRSLVYNIISVVQQRQRNPYNLQPVQQILNLLRKVSFKDEQEQYQLSLKREPRSASRANIK